MTTPLKDIATRTTTTHHYAPWNRDVVFRSLSASQLLELQPLVEKQAQTPAEMVEAAAAILAVVCFDPQGTAEEWLSCSIEELTDLIQPAIAASGLIAQPPTPTESAN